MNESSWRTQPWLLLTSMSAGVEFDFEAFTTFAADLAAREAARARLVHMGCLAPQLYAEYVRQLGNIDEDNAMRLYDTAWAIARRYQECNPDCAPMIGSIHRVFSQYQAHKHGKYDALGNNCQHFALQCLKEADLVAPGATFFHEVRGLSSDVHDYLVRLKNSFDTGSGMRPERPEVQELVKFSALYSFMVRIARSTPFSLRRTLMYAVLWLSFSVRRHLLVVGFVVFIICLLLFDQEIVLTLRFIEQTFVNPSPGVRAERPDRKRDHMAQMFWALQSTPYVLCLARRTHAAPCDGSSCQKTGARPIVGYRYHCCGVRPRDFCDRCWREVFNPYELNYYVIRIHDAGTDPHRTEQSMCSKFRVPTIVCRPRTRAFSVLYALGDGVTHLLHFCCDPT